MFRVTVLVDDNNLVDVLYAVEGLIGQIQITPVFKEEASPRKTITIQKSTNGGDSLKSKVAHLLPSHPNKTISSDGVKRLILEAGGRHNAYNYIIGQLKDARLLRMKRRGMYEIVGSSK